MIIRNYKESDYAGLNKVLKESGIYSKHWDSKKAYKNQEGYDKSSIIVAEKSGEIIGVVILVYNPWRSFVMHLGVLPKYQKKGIGTELLKEAEKRLRKRGIKQTTLLVEKENKSLLPYYENRGWFTAVETFLMEKKL